MRLMICLTNVLCSNEDVEKQPVPIAGVAIAIPVANNEDGSSRNVGGGCKTTQFCYSPIYYYIKIFISVYGTVTAAMQWNKYSTDCGEWANNMAVKAWFLSMIILWAIQAVVHLVFIVTRFITKQPPSNTLYSGKFEAMLRLPLMIELVILIVVAVVGVILLHAAEDENDECVGEFWGLRIHAYTYIVLGLLMILRFGKAPQADASERQ